MWDVSMRDVSMRGMEGVCELNVGCLKVDNAVYLAPY
jgi:hypothetical protein